MAIAPTYFKLVPHGVQYVARRSKRCYLSDHLTIPEGMRCILSFDNLSSRRRGKDASFLCQAVKKESQKRALESYFNKLQDAEDPQLSTVDSKTGHEAEILPQFETESGLNSLEAYLDRIKGDINSENYVSPGTREMITRGGKSMANPVSLASEKFAEKRSSQLYDVPQEQQHDQFDGTSDFFIINIIASLNIAVFLFEIATPIRNSELELFSIPFLYGAKANQLIVIGEWWRLITPMFLHSGFLHLALGCWGLASFGPKVCKGYGSFTFLLIYLLGGISGNLISFLHTPELTVGGTGPSFAMIGAWLIYQIQNKDVIAKEVADSLFQKAIITTALSFLLSVDGPVIDDWTHFGAAITGITYGYFTCPILQMNDASSSSSTSNKVEEGIMLVRRYADPCKSVLVFSLFILVLGSLVLFIQPPFDNSV